MFVPFIPKALRIRLETLGAALDALRVALKNPQTETQWSPEKNNALLGLVDELGGLLRFLRESA